MDRHCVSWLSNRDSYQIEERGWMSLPELPNDSRPVLLLSAVYSGEEKKVYLKFYDPQDKIIYHWRDRTDHKPYCYTKMDFAKQAEQVAQKEGKFTLERSKSEILFLTRKLKSSK